MPTGMDIARFLLVFLRISAFISFAPPTGGRDMPLIARIGVSLTLAALVSSRALWPAVLPSDGVGWVFAAGGEMLVGLALAGYWSLFLGGIQAAGHLNGSQLGFGWGGLYDPTVEDSSEALVLFQRMTFFLLFFAVDGHIRLLEILMRGFDTIPLGGPGFHAATVAVWSEDFGKLFVIGFKLAAPVTVSIWIMTLALGLIGRAAPQMNLLSLDFPLRTGLGFAVMALSAPHIVRLNERLLNHFLFRAEMFSRTWAP